MNLQEIDSELKNLYKQRDKKIKEEFSHIVGQCYHPPGLDVFVYGKAIRGRDVEVIEINNSDVFNAVRNYEDQIFSDSYKVSKEQFKERIKQIIKQIMMEVS